VTLVTSRLTGRVDGFDMEIQNNNHAALSITMDVSRCVNLALQSSPGTLASVSVPPYGRAKVGTLVVVDPAKGYTFVPRFMWTDGISAMQSSKDASPFGTRSPQAPWAAQVARPSLKQVRVVRGRANAKQPKREEISPSVVLVTETTETKPVEIVYWLEVDKATEVVFEADFAGSVNLELVAGGGLKQTTKIAPFGKAEVARLRAINVDAPWKLVCRYVWEEDDVNNVMRQPRFAPDAGDAHSVTTPSKPLVTEQQQRPPPLTAADVKPAHAPRGSVRSLLSSLGMDVRCFFFCFAAAARCARALAQARGSRTFAPKAFADTFEQEELTVDLLKLMVRRFCARVCSFA